MGEMRLSKSKVNSYLTCRFKYYLGYELAIWSLKKSIAMATGLVTRKIIEVYLKRLEEVFSSGKRANSNHEPKVTHSEAPKQDHPGSLTSAPDQPPSTTPTGPASPPEKGDRLKDLLAKFFRLGLKDFKEAYGQYVKEKYGSVLEALTVDQIVEQEKILDSCRKYPKLMEFKAILEGKKSAGKGPSSNGQEPKETKPNSSLNQAKNLIRTLIKSRPNRA